MEFHPGKNQSRMYDCTNSIRGTMKKWNTKSGYEIIRILSGRSNVFLLSNGKVTILIDTSVSRLWPALQKRLNKLGIKTIDYLIITHAHFDHAANASQIKENFNSKVVIHRSEKTYLSSGNTTVPAGTIFLSKSIVKLWGQLLSPLLKYEACKADFLIDSRFDMKEWGFNAFLLHTPGHTDGSISLIIDDEIALVGDAMFGVFKWSVFPPFADNKDFMINSWGKLLQTNCSIFLPSHGTENSRLLVEKDYTKRTKNLQQTNTCSQKK
jgi:glyoxylase-like metal-dependent hydrolase (beta-lactamase superfamily II)